MRILPRPFPLTRPFWEAARARRLVLPRCARCERWAHPQEIANECPCGAERGWVEASGRGAVVSWTVVRKAAHPAVAAEIPYTLFLVRLAEGPQLVSSLGGEGHGLAVGSEVEAFFDDVADDVTLVRFHAP